MALLIQQRVERPDAGERPSARRAFSSAAVCVDCVVCGSPRSQIVCPAEEMAAQRRHLTAFYRRRWRAHNAETAADRLTFTQDYTTDIVRCADCGLLYRNPRPRSDDITRAYRHDRYGDDYLETEFANQRAWARRKLPELRRHLRPSPGRRLRVLEVGSFVGGLLAEGLGRGWDMFGVDPGDEVAAFCRARGLPVFHGTLEQAELQPDSFDAVVVWNTFDQLPDPRPTLEAALRLLRDGGVLTIRIPNGACFAWAMGLLAGSRRALRTPLYTALAWNNLLTFPYIYGYSARTVAAVTASYGFRRIACVPDTLMPPPRDHLRAWARLEARGYAALWRAAWQAAAVSDQCVCAPWLDLYFERAAADDLGAQAAATESGLGLIPVYAPLAFRQTGLNRPA
jgi:SAM-dependent methyltransferase